MVGTVSTPLKTARHPPDPHNARRNAPRGSRPPCLEPSRGYDQSGVTSEGPRSCATWYRTGKDIEQTEARPRDLDDGRRASVLAVGLGKTSRCSAVTLDMCACARRTGHQEMPPKEPKRQARQVGRLDHPRYDDWSNFVLSRSNNAPFPTLQILSMS